MKVFPKNKKVNSSREDNIPNIYKSKIRASKCMRQKQRSGKEK